MEIDKTKAREKFIKEYPNHCSLRLSKTDKIALERAKRAKKRKERKFKVMMMIEKMRMVDKKKLREIGEAVGLTRQRVEQILQNIEKENGNNNS